MFGLEGEFLKNPTDYRSYAVAMYSYIMVCYVHGGA